ncbi:TetR/AcrR family transcriptional regulator [Herpetosiphon gulosus]|uniref:HTH tetR-type domain-containing protein n=1 Tax=Herpetosiphon gulosus TaxID=1973496 RepID=A0ABP9X1B7_9CHLR
MQQQEDIRIQRTLKALRQAFIELIIEQGYEAVTVRAIIQRANVGNKTFYRHYPDKEALLYAVVGEMLIEGQQFLIPPDSTIAAEQNTLNAFRFANQYRDVLRVLLRSPIAEQLLGPMIEFGISEGERSFAGRSLPTDLVSYHFVASMMSLMRWWFERGTQYTPDQMAEFVNKLLIRPMSEPSASE